MQKFVGTILVVLVCLAVFASPVTAGDVLGPGDIAIIGFNLNQDEFSFVCLKTISAGTEIKFTDNGWKDNQTFRTGEGFISWTAPSNGCVLGQIVNVKKSSDPYASIDLDTAGDQIIAFQGILSTPTLIFALNSYLDGWQSSSTSSNSSSLPTVLAVLNPSPSIAIQQTAYAIYSNPKREFTSTSEALAFITNPANWTRSTSVLAMPTGSFTFTTTAVHLSEFSAETEGESAPWWIIAGLVLIPMLVILFKRPKRDCCQ